MSHENAESTTPVDTEAQLRAWFERFNATQEPVLEPMHPEIAWHLRADLPDARILRGYEEVEQLNSDWTAAFENLRLEPTEVRAVAGKTLMAVRFHARIRGTGESVEMNEVWLVSWRDEKIIEIREYQDSDEALKAAGVDA